MLPLRRIFAFATLLTTPACGQTQSAAPVDAGSDAPVFDAKPDGSGHTCVVEGKTFALGEPILTERHCGLCTCAEVGLKCEQGFCPGTCEYEGKVYDAGASFPTANGCNGCVCNQGSRGVSCTMLAFCTYEGVDHCFGTSFKATDGCNDCTCVGDGEVACTKRACVDGGLDGG